MTTVILLRTDYMDAHLRAFALRLSGESGHEVCILADETRNEVDSCGLAKLALTPRVVAAMKLHCPRDFGWRCGDYGFYLARHRRPDADFFWMIEPDTRPHWLDYGALFALFAAERADFIAPHYRRVGKADFWYPTMLWCSRSVWRCLFGFVRMSAAAADLCWEERVRSRWRPEARLMWPNDETFVSTTVAARGLVGKSLDAVHPGLCTPASFDFYTPKAGEEFERSEPDGAIYHPVLYGGMYRRKLDKLAAISGRTGMTLGQRGEQARLRALRAWHKLRTGRVPGFS